MNPRFNVTAVAMAYMEAIVDYVDVVSGSICPTGATDPTGATGLVGLTGPTSLLDATGPTGASPSALLALAGLLDMEIYRTHHDRKLFSGTRSSIRVLGRTRGIQLQGTVLCHTISDAEGKFVLIFTLWSAHALIRLEFWTEGLVVFHSFVDLAYTNQDLEKCAEELEAARASPSPNQTSEDARVEIAKLQAELVTQLELLQ
ncbi:hypothetical protein ZIOFF_073727 [Zingiber officinale]|uniref:Uncharacterized protein n=1 Tax=Zingiber officinale TaxID=94328 RepID=A0A8J5C7J9_ZINOF|nr:hypothetical protein ZIOFF_073727 [Zingiber officinale]